MTNTCWVRGCSRMATSRVAGPSKLDAHPVTPGSSSDSLGMSVTMPAKDDRDLGKSCDRCSRRKSKAGGAKATITSGGFSPYFLTGGRAGAPRHGRKAPLIRELAAISPASPGYEPRASRRLVSKRTLAEVPVIREEHQNHARCDRGASRPTSVGALHAAELGLSATSQKDQETRQPASPRLLVLARGLWPGDHSREIGIFPRLGSPLRSVLRCARRSSFIFLRSSRVRSFCRFRINGPGYHPPPLRDSVNRRNRPILQPALGNLQ